MKEVRLFTPGPTPVPARVREAESAPMIHHRSEEFSETIRSVRRKLKTLCGTSGEVVLYTSSGTGGLEATVSSLFAPGDEVVIVEGGKFGERWVDLAEHYRLRADILRVEWGKAVEPEKVLERLTPKTKGILIQACESSTGAYHPVEMIGKLLRGRDDVLLVVDAITALGVHDMSMDRDRIDVLIGASQKALMCAPGLATLALSPRALARLQQVKSVGFYFSLQRELKNEQKDTTAFTPAISLWRSLDTALSMIEAEGREQLFMRHRKLQKIARAKFREMGQTLFNSDQDATSGITVVTAPKGLDVKKWIKDLRKEHGLWIAGGQGKLEGNIFRVSHMGACQEEDLNWALKAIEGSLRERPGL